MKIVRWKVKVINFKNGLEDGEWTTWYENGQMESKGLATENLANSIWSNWYENGQKMSEGEYKMDDDGNLVIIHSCPDRDIFKMDLKDFLEELFINYEWVTDATLSIM